MTCDERADLLLLYVAGALEEAERDELRRHLASGCVRCAASLAEAQATFDQVGLGVKPVRPPVESWHRLETQIELREQMEGPATGVQTVTPLGSAERKAPRGSPLAWAAAAIAAAAAIVLGVMLQGTADKLAASNVALASIRQQLTTATDEAARRDKQLDTLNTRLVDLQRQLESTATENRRTLVQVQSLQTELADAGKRMQGLLRADQFAAVGKEQPAVKGKLFWDRGAGQWTLFASGVQAPAAGKTYELWIITAAGQKLAAGTAVPDAQGNLVMSTALPANVGEVAAAAVTDEPAPGGPVPQGSVQILASLTGG